MNVSTRSDPVIFAALQVIEAAFSDDDPPAYDQIVSRHEFRWDFERDEIRDFLAGKHWKALTIAELKSYDGVTSAILGFLTPAAYRYYLPAFLTVSLTDWEEADFAVEITFWRFSIKDNPKVQDYVDDRIDALTIQQLDAVASTARALNSVYGPIDTYADAILDIERIKRGRGA
jgi:hypothetical protein